MLCFSRYDKDVHLFKSKVVDSVKLCNSHLFDPPKMDDPYAIRLVKRLHCWNSSSTATSNTLLFRWCGKHIESSLSYPPDSFSPWNPAVHEEAKERMFAYKVNFTISLFFFWIDFKHQTAICSCVAFNVCQRKGFGLASLLALSYVIVEASMLRNCNFVFAFVAAETAWGSAQGSAGVGVVLGEAWINAALQQRRRFPSQLNLQWRAAPTRWRHTTGCHVDAGLPQTVHVGSGTSERTFWTASPHYCSALKASPQMALE